MTVNIPEPEMTEVLAEDIPLNIVYEDDDMLVVDKPAGMVVHPAAGIHRELWLMPSCITAGRTFRQ